MYARDHKETTSEALKAVHQALKNKSQDDLLAIIEKIKATPVAQRIEGPDILCALLNHKSGLAIFFNDEEWRDTVSAGELNDVCERGYNALSLICKTKQGRQLIDEDERFRGKLTADGFSYGLRKSAASQFMIYQADLHILLRHADLCEKISVEVLNEGDSLSVMPIVYELSKTVLGITLLQDPIIREKITVHGLNYGTSYYNPLSFMLRHKEGFALLQNDVCRRKITVEGLNLLDQENKSPVYYLCCTEEGRALLAAHADLRDKITGEVFSKHNGYGRSPAYHLAKSPTGIKALAASKYLRKLLTEETLNETCRYGDDQGASLLFWMLYHPEGVAILLHDKRLRQMIDVRTLLAKITKGEFQGLCAADLLLRPENSALLDILEPRLKAVVNKTHLDHPMQTMLMQQSASGFFVRVQTSGGDDVDKGSRCIIL